MSSMYICSFTSGIDDLTRKQQANFDPVLRVLHATGRFSVFEATANPVIARTMTKLMRSGLVDRIGGAYPWTNVKLTSAGLTAIGADSERRTPSTKEQHD